MSEVVKVRNASYARYEELLLRKDEVKKLAFHFERAYIREFGDLILEVFQKKMEAIRKKKTIEYCQIFANRGESVDQNALQAYLAKEMAEYKERLEEMVRENKEAKFGKKITEVDLLRIKRIYHRMAKKIHPDINPAAAKSEELQGLWNRLKIAYDCNDLKEMEETEVLINMLLEKMDLGTTEITIPDIEKKIAELEAEIGNITGTDPYQYKYLLEDEDAVSRKKEELRREQQEYEDYCKQLDSILKELLHKGVTTKCRMN